MQDYAYTFTDKKVAQEAAERHKDRTNHSPVYIYEIEESNKMTRGELLSMHSSDLTQGIIAIETV